MEQMRNGDIQHDTFELDTIDGDNPYKVNPDGSIILQEDLKEMSEDPKSIEARKKVLDDLINAQSNDLEQENQKEQGE